MSRVVHGKAGSRGIIVEDTGKVLSVQGRIIANDWFLEGPMLPLKICYAAADPLPG